MATLPPLQPSLGRWFALFVAAVNGSSSPLSAPPPSPSPPPPLVGDDPSPGAVQEHITAPARRGPPLRILSPGSLPGAPFTPGVLLRSATGSPPPVDYSTKPRLYISPNPLVVSPATQALLGEVYPQGVPAEVLPDTLPEVVTQHFVSDNFRDPEPLSLPDPFRPRSSSFASARSFDSTVFGAITQGPLAQPFRDFTFGDLFSIQDHVALLLTPGEIEVYRDEPHRLLLYDGDDHACTIVLNHRFHLFPGVSARRRRDSGGNQFLAITPSTWTFPAHYEFLVEVDAGVGYVITGS